MARLLDVRARDHVGACPKCGTGVFVTYDVASGTGARISCNGRCFVRDSYVKGPLFPSKQAAVDAWHAWANPLTPGELEAETAKLVIRLESAQVKLHEVAAKCPKCGRLPATVCSSCAMPLVVGDPGHGPDPYDSDVNDDDSCTDLCAGCHQAHADDI